MGTEFQSRLDLFKLGLVLNHQKSVQGSQTIGATSVIVSAHNNFANEFFFKEGKMVKIIMDGTGGREFSPEEQQFKTVKNQILYQNYPLMFSCNNDLPIRVFYAREDGVTEYRGLWYCVSFKYGKTKKSTYKSYKFVLKLIK